MAPSWREWLWYVLVFLVGSALWFGGLAQVLRTQWASSSLWALGALAVVTFVSLFRYVRLSDDRYYSVYTLDDVPLYALIFLQGWAPAALVAGLTRFLVEVVRLFRAWRSHPERVHWAHVLYHFGDIPQSVNVAAASGVVYGWINLDRPLLGGWQNGLAIAAASLTWFVLAFGQNSLALTLRRQLPISRVFQVFSQNFKHIRLHVLMLVPLGALLALFLERSPWLGIFLVVPIVLMHEALEAQHKLRSEATATMEALATYLEERDPYTQGHSQRVARYGALIAECLDLSEEEIDEVRRAGLIHDIGKVDIPDAILRKPGMLTEDERLIMQTHTDRAVELGQKLQRLSRELPFREAAYHHENYDGTGQFQLVAEEIPLISRILAVADTFDAMTSDRPYRAGMPVEEARKRLREASGTQLDPRCVEAFEKAAEKGGLESILGN